MTATIEICFLAEIYFLIEIKPGSRSRTNLTDVTELLNIPETGGVSPPNPPFSASLDCYKYIHAIIGISLPIPQVKGCQILKKILS
jgi:hypothetical protein